MPSDTKLRGAPVGQAERREARLGSGTSGDWLALRPEVYGKAKAALDALVAAIGADQQQAA